MDASYRLPRGKRIKLSDYDPGDTSSFKEKEEVQERFEQLKEELNELQDKLFAQKKYSLLVVFQGMDCSGKDGAIKKVFSGVNPHGFRVSSFKKPSAEEAAHDFLWRTHREAPAQGYIAAFNRSYYEEVLITRVHGQTDEEEAKRRFKQIKHFEKLMTDNHTRVLKIFLHISKSFQISKLQQRLRDPEKTWKFDPNDILERNYWDDYVQAYEDVFSHCSFKEAPWHIVPSNHRWFRDFVVLSLIVEALRELPLAYPKPDAKVTELIGLLPEDTRPEGAAPKGY